MFAQARDFVVGHVVDKVRLSRLKCRQARRVLGNFFEYHFLDVRPAAPVIIVAREYQIAAALIADELIGASPDEIFIKLVAELVTGDFAHHEAVVETIEKYRIGLFGDEDHRLIVGCLDFRHVFEIGRLQAAAFFVAHSFN